LRRDLYQLAALHHELIFQHDFEHVPALIPNGFQSPLLALAFLPGTSTVPSAEADMFLTLRASAMAMACFLLLSADVC
jgi:hypothetical protein